MGLKFFFWGPKGYFSPKIMRERMDILIRYRAGPQLNFWLCYWSLMGHPGAPNKKYMPEEVLEGKWKQKHSVLSQSAYSFGEVLPRIEQNEVNQYGSAIFFVSNNHDGTIQIEDTIIRNNIGGSWEILPGISAHSDTNFIIDEDSILEWDG